VRPAHIGITNLSCYFPPGVPRHGQRPSRTGLNRERGCGELLDKTGQDTVDRDELPEATPEPFEVFYLREYPKVVGCSMGCFGINQRSSFLRAYLRQQTRERDAAAPASW
jgi:hypothetical protein